MSKTKTGSDFLAHYGVLGMKWGVRKEEDGPSKNQIIKEERQQAKFRVNSLEQDVRSAKKVVRQSKRPNAPMTEEEARAKLKVAMQARKDNDEKLAKLTTGEKVGLGAAYTAILAYAVHVYRPLVRDIINDAMYDRIIKNGERAAQRSFREIGPNALRIARYNPLTRRFRL